MAALVVRPARRPRVRVRERKPTSRDLIIARLAELPGVFASITAIARALGIPAARLVVARREHAGVRAAVNARLCDPTQTDSDRRRSALTTRIAAAKERLLSARAMPSKTAVLRFLGICNTSYLLWLRRDAEFADCVAAVIVSGPSAQR